MLIFPPFPGKTLTSRFDKEFIEERRTALENYFKKVLAVPTIREDGSLMKLLDKSLEFGGMKYFNNIGIKQRSVVELDIFCIDASRSMRKDVDESSTWFNFSAKVSRFQKAVTIMNERLERRKSPIENFYSALLVFSSQAMVLVPPQPNSPAHIQNIQQAIASIQFCRGTAIFRACDLCDTVATEFAAKFFQPVVVNIHLFTDAKDNRSTNEERQSHTTLIQKLGPEGKLKDIYFTALYNYGNDTTYMQQLQQQLPECVVLNTKAPDFPQTIQQLDGQRKSQVEQGIRKDKIVFGVDLQLVMQQQYLSNPELDVPEFLFHAFNSIITTHYQSEGIFRVNSSITKIQALKQQIDQHEQIDFNKLDPDLVANIIKKFFEELPNSLLTNERYKDFLAISDMNKEEQYEALRVLLIDLPECNLTVLIALLKVVSKVVTHSAQNKMTTQNLATCLAPVILKNIDSTTIDVATLTKGNAVVEFMFRNAEQLIKDFMFLPLLLSKRPKDSVVIAAPWTGKREEMIRSLEKRVTGKKVSQLSSSHQIVTPAADNTSKINSNESKQIRISPLPLPQSFSDRQPSTSNISRPKETLATSSPRKHTENFSQTTMVSSDSGLPPLPTKPHGDTSSPRLLIKPVGLLTQPQAQLQSNPQQQPQQQSNSEGSQTKVQSSESEKRPSVTNASNTFRDEQPKSQIQQEVHVEKSSEVSPQSALSKSAELAHTTSSSNESSSVVRTHVSQKSQESQETTRLKIALRPTPPKVSAKPSSLKAQQIQLKEELERRLASVQPEQQQPHQ